MNKTVIAIRKSVVMLFSFALVATLLTLVNVGVNESGNVSLSTVTSAKAISYDGPIGQGNIPIKPSMKCMSNCSVAKGTKAGPGSGGVMDATVKSTYYGCSSVDGAGNCSIGSVVTQDTAKRREVCNMRLTKNGSIVAFSGQMAVQWLRTNEAGWVWNPWGPPENMLSWLTGYETGWGFYPKDWSEVSRFPYSGRQDNSPPIGPYRFFCQKSFVNEPPIFSTKSAVCPPRNDGRPFPYSTGMWVTYKNNDDKTVFGVDNKDWKITAETCVYVSASTPPPKRASNLWTCYWNINHAGFYSTSRASILAGGTKTTNQPTSPPQGAVKPWISGSNSTAAVNGCTGMIDMDADLSLKNGYAYYRLQGSANFQKYQFYIWDTAWTNGAILPADVRATVAGVETKLVYGLNSCTNPGANFRNFPSYSSLPNVTFKYSDCKKNQGSSGWECKIPYAPRVNGVANSVALMRDGSYVKTDLAGVSVSGNGIRDTKNHQVATVADGNMSYLVKVVPGSSPLNGSGNTTKQYFELWKGDRSTETQWNAWISNPNANKMSYLTFYWSSDNGASWKMTYQAKMNTADFAVPWQDSTKTPSYTKWMTETNVDCDTVKTSNMVTVLRSVSSEG